MPLMPSTALRRLANDSDSDDDDDDNEEEVEDGNASEGDGTKELKSVHK